MPKTAIASALADIRIADPVTNEPTTITLFRHPNGAIFGLDAERLETSESTRGESIIFDPYLNADGFDDSLRLRCDANRRAGSDRCTHRIGASPEATTDRITADAHSDDYLHEARFDAVEWFAQASDDEITEIAQLEWGNCLEADRILLAFRTRSSGVRTLLEYTTNKKIGYECQVNAGQAMAWIERRRPELHKTILTLRSQGAW